MTNPTPVKNSHCSYCGSLYPDDLVWPRRCPACDSVTYRNPLPVSVVLLPAGGGLLLVRRTNEPGRGKLGLPGGFIEWGETWRAAGARELNEETGIRIEASGLCLFDAVSAPDSTLLVFGLASPVSEADLPPFVATNETSEIVIGREPMELAFSTHTEMMRRYFEEKDR